MQGRRRLLAGAVSVVLLCLAGLAARLAPGAQGEVPAVWILTPHEAAR